MLTVTIDRDLDESVYEQVAAQIRQLIAAGSLAEGSTLPSVRQLAADLGVSLNTIARAYRLLEAEGFLAIQDRTGVVVSAPAERFEHSARATLIDDMRVILARFKQAGMTTRELLRLTQTEVRALDRASQGRKGGGDD